MASNAVKSFIGKTGKFYIRNPFGTPTKYTFAVYESMDAYLNLKHLPTYANEADAMEDFKEVADIQPEQIKSKYA